MCSVSRAALASATEGVSRPPHRDSAVSPDRRASGVSGKQPSTARQAERQDEDSASDQIEGGVEIGRQARRIGFDAPARAAIAGRNGRTSAQPTTRVDEIADGRRRCRVAAAALEHGIDGAAEIGAEHQGQGPTGVTMPDSASDMTSTP